MLARCQGVILSYWDVWVARNWAELYTCLFAAWTARVHWVVLLFVAKPRAKISSSPGPKQYCRCTGGLSFDLYLSENFEHGATPLRHRKTRKLVMRPGTLGHICYNVPWMQVRLTQFSNWKNFTVFCLLPFASSYFFLVKMTQVSLFPTCRTCNLTGNPKCMKMLLMVEIPNNHLECIKPFTSTGKRRISEPSTISWSHYLHIFFGWTWPKADESTSSGEGGQRHPLNRAFTRWHLVGWLFQGNLNKKEQKPQDFIYQKVLEHLIFWGMKKIPTMQLHLGVSKNSGTTKSSILVGFSI